MDRNDVVMKAKDIIFKNEETNLQQLIAIEPEIVLSALLYANGFTYICLENDNNQIRFIAGNSKDDMEEKLVYSEESREIYGCYEQIIIQTYDIVNLIESTFERYLLYPIEARLKAISQICEDARIDETEYQKVLRNWI